MFAFYEIYLVFKKSQEHDITCILFERLVDVFLRIVIMFTAVTNFERQRKYICFKISNDIGILGVGLVRFEIVCFNFFH